MTSVWPEADLAGSSHPGIDEHGSAATSGAGAERGTGPLSGIRVVDLGRAASTPIASMILADLGADVVKVESLEGDFARRAGQPSRNGVEAWFINANRGKRSLAVDLRTSDGVQAVLDVATTADVFLQNFRPGVINAIGLGYDAVRTVNPDVVYASVSGFGPDGPYADRPAYDTVIQGLSGIVALQRFQGKGEPDLVRQTLADKVTAWTVAQSVIAALFARERGSGGQHIEVPMLDTALYFLWQDSMSNLTFVGEHTAGRVGSKWLTLTRTRDGHITQLAINFRQRQGLLKAIGRNDLLDDPRFSTTDTLFQPANLQALHEEFDRGAAEMSSTELTAALDAHGVPCGPVLELDEIVENEQVRAAEILVEWEDACAGTIRSARPPARYSGTPTQLRTGVPPLGAANDNIIRGAHRRPSLGGPE
jgi:crotonobetainyl-CoA:carnitine CoA-transferase CaiB-like acyl-CoA transferase